MTDDIIREHCRSFLKNYQEAKQIISGNKFNFESVELMDYKLHRVRLKRDGLYKKSLKWLLYKGATINPKNENDEICLQYGSHLTLNL